MLGDPRLGVNQPYRQLLANLMRPGAEPLGYLTDVLTRIVNGHPTARSTISCRGPISRPPSSRPRPENSAYLSSSGMQEKTLHGAITEGRDNKC